MLPLILTELPQPGKGIEDLFYGLASIFRFWDEEIF